MEFNFGLKIYQIPKEIIFEILFYVIDFSKQSCLLSKKESNLRLISRPFYFIVNNYICFLNNKNSKNCIFIPFIWLKLGIQNSSTSVYISKKQFCYLTLNDLKPHYSFQIKHIKVLNLSLKELLLLDLKFESIECLQIYDFESFFSNFRFNPLTENHLSEITFSKLKKLEIRIYKFVGPQENNKLVLLYQFINQIYQYSKNEITLKIKNLSNPINFSHQNFDNQWEQIYQNFLLSTDFIQPESFKLMIHTLILKDIGFGLPEHFENLQVLKIINTRNKTNIHINVFCLLKNLRSLFLTNLEPIIKDSLKFKLFIK